MLARELLRSAPVGTYSFLSSINNIIKNLIIPMVTQEEIEEIILTYYGERKPVHNPRVLHADGATISVEWWLDGIVRVKALRPGPGNSDYQILSDI